MSPLLATEDRCQAHLEFDRRRIDCGIHEMRAVHQLLQTDIQVSFNQMKVEACNEVNMLLSLMFSWGTLLLMGNFIASALRLWQVDSRLLPCLILM